MDRSHLPAKAGRRFGAVYLPTLCTARLSDPRRAVQQLAAAPGGIADRTDVSAECDRGRLVGGGRQQRVRSDWVDRVGGAGCQERHSYR
ncbi:hypothetical protein D3C80_1975830 [compost metagenome]